jgi:CheY-like chemotaxis protein
MLRQPLKEHEERSLADSMDAYISKPIDLNNILQVIWEIIKQKSNVVCCQGTSAP